MFPCISLQYLGFTGSESESDKDQQMPKVLSNYKTALLEIQGLFDLKARVYSLYQYFPNCHYLSGFPSGSDNKESACNARDSSSVPQLGRSPGGGHGNLLQYSCLENFMYRRAWQVIVHGVAKSWIDWATFTFRGPRRVDDVPPTSTFRESNNCGTAAAAKSLQSCLTLCDPRDGSPQVSSVPRILQARILEWVDISLSNACMYAKSCTTLCDLDSSPPGSLVHGMEQTTHTKKDFLNPIMLNSGWC